MFFLRSLCGQEQVCLVSPRWTDIVWKEEGRTGPGKALDLWKKVLFEKLKKKKAYCLAEKLCVWWIYCMFGHCVKNSVYLTMLTSHANEGNRSERWTGLRLAQVYCCLPLGHVLQMHNFSRARVYEVISCQLWRKVCEVNAAEISTGLSL